jgi:hypothetical protein
MFMGSTQNPKEPQEPKQSGLVGDKVRGVAKQAGEAAAIPLQQGLATVVQGVVDILRMVVDLLQGVTNELRGNPGTLAAQLQAITKAVPTLLHTAQSTVTGVLGGLTGERAEKH